MKTLIVSLLLVLATSCKTTKQNLPVQNNKVYDYRHEINASYVLQKNNIHYYNDLNTVFIKLSKQKAQGC